MKTLDFTTQGDASPRFHAPEKIGPKRAKTPEGFLVCYDVPLARTGFQDYAAHEIEDAAITAPPDGYFRVERLADEVFAPTSLTSWNGKPVTNDHPPDLLTPADIAKYQVGTMINPRQGHGDHAHLLLVDMIITDPTTMADVEAGKREMSGGYDCEYFEVAPGHLQQRGIVGNHGALVDEGRCGEACAIQDHKPRMKFMSTILEQLKKAFTTKDEKAFAAALGAVAMRDEEGSVRTEGGSHEIHLHIPGTSTAEEQTPKKEDPMDEAPAWFKKFGEGHDAWMKSHDEWKKNVDEFMKGKPGETETDAEAKEVEGGLEEEAPPGTALKDARGAKDSAYLVDAFQETVAGAEVLAPGISVPTLDRSALPKKTFKDICGLRRRALDHAAASMETREMLSQVTGGRMIDTKTANCRDVRSAFRATVALKRAANKGAPGILDTHTGTHTVVGVKSLADLNKMNRERYAAKA